MYMPTPYTTVGFWTLQTYTLALALGIGVSTAYGLYRARKRPGALVDVALGALVVGLLLARLEHVLLNWNYFAYNVNEAFQLNAGGLDWHGAVIGGLLGGYIVARWRRVGTRDLLDPLILALPLIAHAAWYGCWAANCAYGVEVDTLAHFPSWAVGETADIYGIAAPRYNTQIFGLWLTGVLLIIAMILLWRGWLRDVRFWLILALFSLGMFVIGFFRGDYSPMLNGLRLDQWLDAIAGISALAVGTAYAVSLRNPNPIANRQ
jgi:phosphatidylglycerol:prolipoprotein diacylglycerol transferase